MHTDADFARDYLECASVVRELLATEHVAREWDAPSVLPLWTVGGLAGHLARPVLTVPGFVVAEAATKGPVVSSVEYFAVMPDEDNDPSSEVATFIRQRGVETAGDGPADLLHRFDVVMEDLPAMLMGAGADHEVVAFGRRMRLDQYLVTRVVEMIVHADDLAVSVGTATPGFPESASDVCLATLAAIASRRRGAVGVMRALARSERAPTDVSAF